MSRHLDRHRHADPPARVDCRLGSLANQSDDGHLAGRYLGVGGGGGGGGGGGVERMAGRVWRSLQRFFGVLAARGDAVAPARAAGSASESSPPAAKLDATGKESGEGYDADDGRHDDGRHRNARRRGGGRRVNLPCFHRLLLLLPGRPQANDDFGFATLRLRSSLSLLVRAQLQKFVFGHLLLRLLSRNPSLLRLLLSRNIYLLRRRSARLRRVEHLPPLLPRRHRLRALPPERRRLESASGRRRPDLAQGRTRPLGEGDPSEL
mmetsp:Transcript_2847/g.8992  ORF Transcript_2847/g.8992 Transcript_2847/m.8992 type:complete len:264 (+) Transcript_2847:910-1701(+)